MGISWRFYSADNANTDGLKNCWRLLNLMKICKPLMSRCSNTNGANGRGSLSKRAREKISATRGARCSRSYGEGEIIVPMLALGVSLWMHVRRTNARVTTVMGEGLLKWFSSQIVCTGMRKWQRHKRLYGHFSWDKITFLASVLF